MKFPLPIFSPPATHTSGLPSSPDNLNGEEGGDPFTDYDLDDLYEYLSTYEPDAVGQSFLYSNLGFATLSEALAMADGQGRDFQQVRNLPAYMYRKY